MASYNYTTVTGRIGTLLDKIHDVGIPPKATTKWLSSVGLTSSNDRSLIGVLKQIGFVDESGTPTETWHEYKKAGVADRRKVLAAAVRKGYQDLYQTYSDAHVRSETDIENYFRSHVTAGSDVLRKTIQTYRALASLADFSEVPSPAVGGGSAPPTSSPSAPVAVNVASPPVQSSAPGMSVAINIQLTVPETSDPKVYDAFFAAMKKHLID